MYVKVFNRALLAIRYTIVKIQEFNGNLKNTINIQFVITADTVIINVCCIFYLIFKMYIFTNVSRIIKSKRLANWQK